jgi:hypothetical protein
MPVDFENDATLNDAIARLEGAEAAETPMEREAFVQAEDGNTQQTDDGQQPAAGSEKTGDTPLNKSSETDTPAAADQKPPDGQKKDDKGTQKPGDKSGKTPDPKAQSKFAADKERLDKTWKSVNDRKTELDTRETTLKAKEQALAIREQKAAVTEARAKNKFTPEQYLTAGQNKLKAAENLAVQADGWDRRADELERNGKFAEAEQHRAKAKELREQSQAERYQARQMEQMADHLRKNPDPTLEQHKATMESHKKHYLIEAAKRWPDVAVPNSEFQKVMAGHLQAAAQQGLDPAENPVVFYHAARLTAAETAAARVPDLEKKLSAAEAKIKELEALTAPGGGKGSAQTQPQQRQLTDEEEGEQLRQMAQQL